MRDPCDVRWAPFVKCWRCRQGRSPCVPVPDSVRDEYEALQDRLDAGSDVEDEELDTFVRLLDAAAHDRSRHDSDAPAQGSQRPRRGSATTSSTPRRRNAPAAPAHDAALTTLLIDVRIAFVAGSSRC